MSTHLNGCAHRAGRRTALQTVRNDGSPGTPLVTSVHTLTSKPNPTRCRARMDRVRRWELLWKAHVPHALLWMLQAARPRVCAVPPAATGWAGVRRHHRLALPRLGGVLGVGSRVHLEPLLRR